MILVDPDQPLLKPSMSQLQLTKCSEGGQFQIKAWHSNSQEVDQTSGERYTDLLGHKWDKQEDTFALKKDSVVRKKEDFTKRSCLALLAQVWDPIGLVAPVTIKYRIDLQELWSTGYGWDDILPEAIQQEWKENEEAINQLLSFKFDRKLKPDHAIGPPQVHGFADGGEVGYGAAIFLCWKLQDGSQHPRIIFPLKKWQNYCRERDDFQIAMPGWSSMALRYNLGSMLT